MTDDVRLAPRPATTLRERIAERTRYDAMVFAGVRRAHLEALEPWETLSDHLRGPWLRQADSALAVVRDFGVATPIESSPS